MDLSTAVFAHFLFAVSRAASTGAHGPVTNGSDSNTKDVVRRSMGGTYVRDRRLRVPQVLNYPSHVDSKGSVPAYALLVMPPNARPAF